MELPGRAIHWAQIELLGDLKRILLENTKPPLDLHGILRGMMALEDSGLYNMEENVGRLNAKIDLGVELYDMENWE